MRGGRQAPGRRWDYLQGCAGVRMGCLKLNTSLIKSDWERNRGENNRGEGRELMTLAKKTEWRNEVS